MNIKICAAKIQSLVVYYYWIYNDISEIDSCDIIGFFPEPIKKDYYYEYGIEIDVKEL